MSASGTRSYSCDMCCICRITVLSFDWFDCRIIQIDYQVLVDCIFIRRFWVAYWLYNLIHSSCLCPTMVSCDSIILTILLVVLKIDAFVRTGIMLNGIIINWVFSDLINVLHRWTHHFVQFPALLLFRVQWSCHIEILLLIVNDVRTRRLINGVSLTLHHRLILLIGCSLCRFFDGRWHFHLPFEIHFGLLVTLLSVLELLISSID